MQQGWKDGRTAMQARYKGDENLLAAGRGIASMAMGYAISVGRKTVKPPLGYEGHLTRREAAMVLGLPSEFKIRQLEREGRLHAIRGQMGTAFYPEDEVLALKAELGARVRPQPGCWTDADLLALLQRPTSTGRPRTAVDLVTEAKISIARAERVVRFWCNGQANSPVARTVPEVAVAAVAPTAPRPTVQEALPREPSPAAKVSGRRLASERRSSDRLTRDQLVRSLRDPDPRVRDRAFAQLKDDSPSQD